MDKLIVLLWFICAFLSVLVILTQNVEKPLRAEVREMVEYAKLAAQAESEMMARYDADFKIHVQRHRGEPSFTWYVAYDQSDPYGEIFQRVLLKNECFWRFSNIYSRRVTVQPRSVQEIVKC